MASEPRPDHRVAVRRALSRVLVVSLCLAAVIAVAAIMSGDFDDTDARVIATSLGFAVFSATAASGASVRHRQREALRALGAATVALSVVSFLFLVLALWGDGREEPWRWLGCATLATLAGSHASLMSRFLQAMDTDAVRALGTASIAFGLVDAAFGIAAISGAIDEVTDGAGQLLAALVVLLVLTTALAPILRRMSRPREALIARSADLSPQSLADHVMAAAARIEALTAGPASRAPEIRRECERLRELARQHSA
jgi:peptidoglycan/LPS O-acetylase OafA/YrhL